MKNTVILALLAIITIACNDNNSVKNDNIGLFLSDGVITDINFGQPGNKKIKAYTQIGGCHVVSETKSNTSDGQSEFIREFTDSAGHKCTVTDRFISKPDCVEWKVEIKGDDNAWTAPIETVIEYPADTASRFWTTGTAMEDSKDKWCDPLELRPFKDLNLNYGGGDIFDPCSLVIPVFTVCEPATGKGFTIAQSPRDTILNLKLLTKADGTITIRRENHKIHKDNTIRIKMNLVGHSADWRSGLDFYVKKYTEFFEPVSPLTNDVAGCGAYSSWEGALDTTKLNKWAFSFNWKATFDFPYMGLFLPEVTQTSQRWERFHQGGIKVGDGFTSVDGMESYMKRMKDLGYHVLCYFNLTEAGNRIQYPAPPRKAKNDTDLWRDPNDFIYYTDINKALLKRFGAENDSPVFSNWEECVVVDPGEPVYKKHLMEQAKRHIDYLPSNSGLCIDRLDWLREYNIKGNDGVSWKDNVPSRSLLLSWKEVMNELGPMMHSANKVIFANVLTSRIDILEHIDAIYDEYGQLPLSLNRSAFMTLNKPLIAWTSSVNDFKPDPDSYFQRHLYLGAFLTVPYPGNDHTILPDPEIEKYYTDYGDMLKMLKGKRWVLTPDVVKIEEGNAKVNVFETQSAYVIPVVMATGKVAISVNGLTTDFSNCKILYPGKTESITCEKAGSKALFTINTERGCGMLVIGKK